MSLLSVIRSARFRRVASYCRVLAWRGCIILLFALVALVVWSWFTVEWTEEESTKYPGGTVLRDASGEVLRVSLGPGDVDCRPYYTADPEDWIVKALVAVEDGSFWTHHGVRPLSIMRAVAQNLFYRRRISGASTITMQAVRLIQPHPKTFWWKWKEAIMALKMERIKDKRWILSQYLNRAPYGSNFIGIESAARGWFGKGAKELGPAEAAILAGMVQAPSRFRPDRGYEKAMKRRDYVLDRMHQLGYLDSAQLKGARQVKPVVCRLPRPFKAPYYCDWILSGTKAVGGCDIVTPLRGDLQALCEAVVESAAAEGGYSVATVIRRVDTGEVIALTCSGDYFNPQDGQVNTAVARRPAGSTLKPFLVALAMDRGVVTPSTRLEDAPLSVKGYRPANFDAKYRGRVTVRDALIESLNVPFVRLLKEIGLDAFSSTLSSLGFASLARGSAEYGLGLAIGNADVSLVELTGAYRTIAASGGEVFSNASSYLVSEMLSKDERSSAALGHIAEVVLPRFAWKTGTSSAYRDAWTVLWNPEYVVGVWCGHKVGGFNDHSLIGAKAAAPIAWTLARRLYPQNDGPWFVEPDELERREICSLSGRPVNPNCPTCEVGVMIRGRSSAALCAEHRRLPSGEVVTGRRKPLSISRPEDGSEFMLVPNGPPQKLVCHVTGVDGSTRLWWFLDDVPIGESVGTAPFSFELTLGFHRLICSTAEGETSAITFSVSSR